MIKRCLFLFSMLLLGTVAWCQYPSKADLEKERASIKRDIEELNATLKQTTKNRKVTLGQLAAVQKKLRQREALISNINKQINLIEGDIYQSNRDIYKLRKELDTLKIQYEKSVVYAYKNRSNYDFLNFLFSSTSFNDALKRVAYLRSYRNYREQQAATIRNTQDILKQKITGLNENKKKKGEVLQEENKERVVLQEERQEKNAIVSQLKSREKELNKELTAKKKKDRALTNAIATAIRRAREEAIKEAKAAAEAAAKRDAAAKIAAPKTNTPSAPATTTPSATPSLAKRNPTLSPLDTDPASRKLSDDFYKEMGNLPWPVDKGSVRIHFGRYAVEGTSIQGDNPGITIETEPGKQVKAVFSGEVTYVGAIGSGQTVIIRHGKYFSTYSNLASATVSKGEKITLGQAIGKAGTNEDDNGEIEFLITNDTNRNLDPERWLRN